MDNKLLKKGWCILFQQRVICVKSVGCFPEVELNNWISRCSATVDSVQTTIYHQEDGNLLFVAVAVIKCDVKHGLLFDSIDHLNLDLGVKNILKENHVMSVGQLLEMGENKVRTFPGLGDASMSRIEKALEEEDLYF